MESIQNAKKYVIAVIEAFGEVQTVFFNTATNTIKNIALVSALVVASFVGVNYGMNEKDDQQSNKAADQVTHVKEAPAK